MTELHFGEIVQINFVYVLYLATAFRISRTKVFQLVVFLSIVCCVHFILMKFYLLLLILLGTLRFYSQVLYDNQFFITVMSIIK